MPRGSHGSPGLKSVPEGDPDARRALGERQGLRQRPRSGRPSGASDGCRRPPRPPDRGPTLENRVHGCPTGCIITTGNPVDNTDSIFSFEHATGVVTSVRTLPCHIHRILAHPGLTHNTSVTRATKGDYLNALGSLALG